MFVGRRGGVQRLYVRDLDSREARPLEGTEGAQVPVVSPDGRWVAFWAGRAIRRVPLSGGPAAILVQRVPGIPSSLAWRGDGRLFYDGPQRVIWSAEAEHAPTAVTTKREEVVPYEDGQIVAIDLQGRVSPLEAPVRSYGPGVALSPDGRQLAVVIQGLTERWPWLYDRGRGTLTRLPMGGEGVWLRWAPGGDRLAFFALDKGWHLGLAAGRRDGRP